jgi:RHS repeat-associated protein
VRVFENDVLEQEYTYDTNGNRLSLTTSEGTINATYDDQDRLLTYGELVFTYTANGEVLTKTDTSTGETWAYEYDVRGNLVRVDLPDGRVIEYLVDGRDRRGGKLVDGGLVKQWGWAGDLRMTAELDGEGNVLWHFAYSQHSMTTPSLAIQGTAVYRVITDHLGSVRVLQNANDALEPPVTLNYDAFGTPASAGPGVLLHGFGGGLYDSDTGLVRFGARDHDPATGRWLSKDPALFAGGDNLYTFAQGDPINHVDVDGRLSVAAAALLAAGGASMGCMLIAAVPASAKYGKRGDDQRRHCYWHCIGARMCGPIPALAGGLGWELVTGFRGDWREDLRSNAAGVGAAYGGLYCDQQCETCPLR